MPRGWNFHRTRRSRLETCCETLARLDPLDADGTVDQVFLEEGKFRPIEAPGDVALGESRVFDELVVHPSPLVSRAATLSPHSSFDAADCTQSSRKRSLARWRTRLN